MQGRRRILKQASALAGLMATLSLLPREVLAQATGWNKAAFDAKSIDEVMKALGAGKPVESKDVTLTAPDIAENGAVVPVAASVAAPGLKRLLLLVDKNPNTLAGFFDFTDAIEPAVSTRVKMAQTSTVYAVAITADNKVLFAQKEVKVTLGGCGG